MINARQMACLSSSGALLLLSLAVLAGCQPAEPPAAEPVQLEGVEAQASYSLGYSIGADVGADFAPDLDHEAFLTGMADALEGDERRLTEEEAQAALTELMSRRQAAAAEAANATLDAGAAFLAENGQREGVVTTDSGLQYEVLTAAEGPKPSATDRVTTHYHGTLIDGTVFDSSVARDQPATFALNQVIPGWTEALQLMSVGAKWRLYLPAELAYGPRATGAIPANSALIFEVELLAIEE